jgi:hypothetical protein
MKFTDSGHIRRKLLNPNAEVHVLSKIEEEGRFSDFCQTKIIHHIYSTEAITIVNKTFVPESALKRP